MSEPQETNHGSTLRVRLRRALLSVSDKSGLEALAKALIAHGTVIFASGGTARFLAQKGIACRPVEELSQSPEAFGGRMKTLSFGVVSALLFRRDEESDVAQARALGIAPIDLLVCNLYPFAQTVRELRDWSACIEMIDIGAALIRAAAKNYRSVTVACDPKVYTEIISDLDRVGGTTVMRRQKLAYQAFCLCAAYDSLIANRFAHEIGQRPTPPLVELANAKALRYGENPHQRAFVTNDPLALDGLASTPPLIGKALSYNNLLDANAALACTRDAHAACPGGALATVVKHMTPCGVASAKTGREALAAAIAADKMSAFGSVICMNCHINEELACLIDKRFTEVVIAPSFDEAAVSVLAKRKGLRLIALASSAIPASEDSRYDLRSVDGGYLLCERDHFDAEDLTEVTHMGLSADHKRLARFGIAITGHIKSNAIGLFALREGIFSMVGAGAGNPNRLESVRQATHKARENGWDDLGEVLLVSDAFFPFPDAVLAAKAAGIGAIIQPGGSVKDREVIAAADANGIAMAFTGRRHFRH